MVFLRLCAGLNLGSKVMTQNANISISVYFAILYKNTRLRFLRFFRFCVLCHTFCTNQDLQGTIQILRKHTWNHPETFHPRYGKLNFRHKVI